MTGVDEVATADQQFIYRAIFSDGRVQETQPRTFRPRRGRRAADPSRHWRLV